jgi:hypothetical protein
MARIASMVARNPSDARQDSFPAGNNQFSSLLRGFGCSGVDHAEAIWV